MVGREENKVKLLWDHQPTNEGLFGDLIPGTQKPCEDERPYGVGLVVLVSRVGAALLQPIK